MLSQDLLLIDCELAYPEAERGAILQLAGVLLDKKNLLEKKQFESYARPSLLDGSTTSLAKNLGVPPETIKLAPRLPEVLKSFFDYFRDSYQIACFGITPYIALAAANKKSGNKKPLDLPIFDAWTVLYTHSEQINTLKLPNLETFASQYKLNLKNSHNAMERIKLISEILRKTI